MDSLPYIIEVQVCFALLWIIYRLAMHRSGRLSHNRAYLLVMAAVSSCCPRFPSPYTAPRSPSRSPPGYRSLKSRTQRSCVRPKFPPKRAMKRFGMPTWPVPQGWCSWGCGNSAGCGG